jgi:transcriptional regulator with XRE-family HTH domain
MFNKLREHRLDLGLTQAQFAEITKISRYKIQCLEQGCPALTKKEAAILAIFFGFKATPSFLLDLIVLADFEGN